MLALTQCWYTRVHVADGRPHREADGSLTSECRHCGRAIVSHGKSGKDRSRWYLADGFDVTRLASASTARFLYLIDTADEFVIARFGVGHLADEAAIAEYAAQLREEHEVDEPGSVLQLRDSLLDR